MRREQLKKITLSLASKNITTQLYLLDNLSSSERQLVIHWINEHRIGPIIRWLITSISQTEHFPLWLNKVLEEQQIKTQTMADSIQSEILKISRLLSEKSIPHVFLKGAYLARSCYPSISLRPMRDIDVLVPPEYALQASFCLFRGGFNPVDRSRLPNQKYNKEEKHLPRIKGIHIVEIHTKLMIEPEHDQANHDGFWQRINHCDIDNQSVAYISPTDLLFHLILHSVYDHHLDNGPLLLSDIHFLLETTPIDWLLFWQLAEKFNASPSCYWILQLVQHYWKPESIKEKLVIPETMKITQEQLDIATSLFFSHVDSRNTIQFILDLDRHKNLVQKSRYLFARIFLNHQNEKPVSPSFKKLFHPRLLKPSRWLQLFTIRIPEILKTYLYHSSKQERQYLASLKKWLESP